MLAQLLLASDLPWPVAAGPVIGLASAGLTLYLGRLLIRPRGAAVGAPPAPEENPEKPNV